MLAVVLIITVLNVVIFLLANNSGQFQLTVKEWFSSLWFAGISLGTIGVIFLGSLIRGIQISGGGQSVAKMVNARAISMDTKDKLERRLINVVEEMSIASGTAIPALFIMDEEKGMNAFVAGLVPSDTVLVITQGLLDNLDRQELQGVVAHEYSHIFNSDMRMNVRLIAILGGILALGQLGYFLLRSLRYSGRRQSSSNSNNQSGLVIIGAAVALLVVGYIGLFFGRLIKAAISRQREFLADASAVQFSRDSMGIANALYRIKTNGKGSLLDSSHAEDMSHMCFGSALKFTAFSGLLATHPPIDERIKTLVPGYRHKKSTPPQSVNTDTDSVSSSFSEGQSNTVLEDALEIHTAEQMVEQIGQLHPKQLAKAEVIHKSIPEQLHNAAHDSNDAGKLILALITANSDGSIEDLFQPIQNRLTGTELKTVSFFSEIIENLSDELLLPLVNMTIPALKQSDAQQKKNLLATASLLISADKKIKPFEFFLYALLRKNLSKKDAAFSNTTYRKYKPVLNEIQFLLSVIAQAGGENIEEVISLAMKSFDHNWQIPKSLPTYNAAQLNKSLQKLNQLTPLLKKPLMQTMAEMVMNDGDIKRSEVELIRAAGIYLECPVPPLF
ncbi:MAG: M48 family metallopeptidase [Gammaproteobacteria bacterium]|nr:M48 family metallopeptidase [Gammaproteobacteria bacterium]